jgi:ABC-type transport system involved in cytochrome bd biosynthesis fused ATPase/permease subunit
VTLHRVRAAPPGRDRPVLDGASLRIRPGETVVVVGANGAGKTTTLSLLIGFLLPTEGAVRVGDADLRELDPGLWRRRLSYLPERPALLAASLADNLRLADPAAGDARLCELLEAVGGADLLARLPDGLATRLGEGGRAVSAGERQRIALARALLRPASLYLLDEPTVHLDEATEARVVEALCRHLEGRSAVIVSHRPAVAGLADRVVTLEAGSFTAAGALPPPVRRSPLGVPA